MSYRRVNSVRDPTSIAGDIRLPYPDHEPPCSTEKTPRAGITKAIRGDLGDPVRCVRASRELSLEPGPRSTVPEVAITEHDDTGRTEHDIRLSGHRADIPAIPESTLRESPAQHDLRPGVRRCIPALRARACLGGGHEALEAGSGDLETGLLRDQRKLHLTVFPEMIPKTRDEKNSLADYPSQEELAS